MKKLFLFSAIFLCLFAVSCKTDTDNNSSDPSSGSKSSEIGRPVTLPKDSQSKPSLKFEFGWYKYSNSNEELYIFYDNEQTVRLLGDSKSKRSSPAEYKKEDYLFSKVKDYLSKTADEFNSLPLWCKKTYGYNEYKNLSFTGNAYSSDRDNFIHLNDAGDGFTLTGFYYAVDNIKSLTDEKPVLYVKLGSGIYRSASELLKYFTITNEKGESVLGDSKYSTNIVKVFLTKSLTFCKRSTFDLVIYDKNLDKSFTISICIDPKKSVCVNLKESIYVNPNR